MMHTSTIPGWLSHRAKTAGFTRITTILAPVTGRDPAIYLLEDEDRTAAELHVVEDAASGIEGATIPLARRELCDLAVTLAHTVARDSARTETVPA